MRDFAEIQHRIYNQYSKFRHETSQVCSGWLKAFRERNRDRFDVMCNAENHIVMMPYHSLKIRI